MNLKIYLKELRKNYKNKGLRIAFQRFICKIIGVEEQISTLNYFLNQFHSPASLPPTSDPELRVMQECDALLLLVFDRFCKKYNLTYWLDFGTLLGAVRHKGFIPWDDDMDVAMPREDYNKLLELLKQEFGNGDFNIRERKPAETIGFGYQHEKTGVWLDVFPVDAIPNCEDISVIENSLAERLYKYRKFYNKHHNSDVIGYYAAKRKSIIEDEFAGKGDHTILYTGAEFSYSLYLTRDASDVYPLISVTFEGNTFPAPQNIQAYLRRLYGNNYMGFPKEGVLHHSQGRGSLSSWAKLNNVDMNKVKDKLLLVADSLKQ